MHVGGGEGVEADPCLPKTQRVEGRPNHPFPWALKRQGAVWTTQKSAISGPTLKNKTFGTSGILLMKRASTIMDMM